MIETFTRLSDNAVYSATVVFTLAMIAHVAEWAMARQLLTAAPARAKQSALVSTHTWAIVVTPFADTTVALDPVRFPGNDKEDLERSDRFGRIGLALTVLGFSVLAGGVLFRGLAAGRVPWGNMDEFSITGCLAVSAAYIILVRTHDVHWLGLLVTGFLVMVLAPAPARTTQQT